MAAFSGFGNWRDVHEVGKNAPANDTKFVLCLNCQTRAPDMMTTEYTGINLSGVSIGSGPDRNPNVLQKEFGSQCQPLKKGTLLLILIEGMTQ